MGNEPSMPNQKSHKHLLVTVTRIGVITKV